MSFIIFTLSRDLYCYLFAINYKGEFIMAGKILLMGEPMALFIANETGEISEVSSFSASIAGAEYNVAIGLCRMGHQPVYCTKLGGDPFADKIVAAMQRNGIDTGLVMTDPDKLTGFMIKSKVINGDPKIAYYRKNSAASSISTHDVDRLDLFGIDWLHITGILPAVSDSALKAVKRLVERAAALRIPISFDPNLRPQLWESEKKMVAALHSIAQNARLVLPGISEGKILTGEETPEKIARAYHEMGVQEVIVKLGAKGAYYSEKEGENDVAPAFPVEKIVDTVGAGDGFAAGVISALCEGLTLREAAERGNVVGAIQITNKSDNEGLPTKEELREVIQRGAL